MDVNTERDTTKPDGRGLRQRTVIWLTAAVAVLAVLVAASAIELVGGSPPPPPASDERGLQPVTGEGGDPLPLQTLPGFSNRPAVDLSDYVGEALVVNFWATWCGPCVREMPMLRDVSGDLSGRVTFLGVNVQDSTTHAEEFLDDVGVRYDQAADPGRDYFRAVGGIGMPTTLLVDAEGIVRYRHTGELTEQKLRALLREHLAVS